MSHFTCSVCCDKAFISSAVNELIKHLRREHALFDGSKLNLKCCCPPCELSFKTYSGFRKHLLKHDTSTTQTNVTPIKVAKSGDAELDIDTNAWAVTEILRPETQACHTNVNSSKLLHNLTQTDSNQTSNRQIVQDSVDQRFSFRTKFLLQLESTGIPKSSLDYIIASTDELLLKVFDEISIINNDGYKDKEIELYVTNQVRLLKENNSKYKRHKLFSKLPDFVEPVQLSLGTRHDQKYDQSLQTYKTVALPCNMTYVPILQTLGFIFADEYIRSVFLDQLPVDSGIMRSFSDGTYYASNPFYKIPHKIRLHLYYDDFESVNPLGSKTSGHKLGAFYMTIQNLPPELNTKLHNIHLVALFYTADIKRYGMNSVLKPIIDDIKKLETEGILIGTTKFEGTLAGLSFDNLGGNSLYGMVESFVGTNYCRMCIATKQECRIMVVENPNILRSGENFQFDETLEVPQLGIKYRTLINLLRHFNVFDCPSVDVMHDILEGIAPLEIKLFLRFIIALKLITIEELNARIKTFIYGEFEMKNKPSPICLDKPGTLIGQRAAQSWCLLRFLPLLIADIVRKGSPAYDLVHSKWRVIVLLIQIASIVFSPVLSCGLVEQLKFLIEEHHALFQKEFERHLTPKHHFMTHYPTVIRRIGPLVHFWSMRFEGKHNYFKQLLHQYRNFKNITKTLASQHQRYMYHQHKIVKNCNESKLETTSGKFMLYEALIERFGEIDDRILKIDKKAEVYATKKILIRTTYRLGCYIISGTNDQTDLPIFHQICQPFIFKNIPFAICKTYECQSYDDDLCAFIIGEPSIQMYSLINIANLSHKLAYNAHQASDNSLTKFIVPKYQILS